MDRETILSDEEFMDGIRRGCAQVRDGNVRSWEEIKSDLGIED